MSETESRPRRRGKPADYDDDIVIVEGLPVRREWAEEQDWIDVRPVGPSWDYALYKRHDYRYTDDETYEDYVVWSDSANTCGLVVASDTDHEKIAEGIFNVHLLKKALELAEFAGWQNFRLSVTEMRHAPDANGLMIQPTDEDEHALVVAGRVQEDESDE